MNAFRLKENIKLETIGLGKHFMIDSVLYQKIQNKMRDVSLCGVAVLTGEVYRFLPDKLVFPVDAVITYSYTVEQQIISKHQ